MLQRHCDADLIQNQGGQKELDITTQSSTTENCIQVFGGRNGPKSHQTQKYKHQVYM